MRAGITSHLNLKWSVADMDRLAFMEKNKHLTLEAIALKLEGTIYQTSVDRLREIAEHFGTAVQGMPQDPDSGGQRGATGDGSSTPCP